MNATSVTPHTYRRHHRRDGTLAAAQYLHVDDLSSDDDEESRNTIGRVPLHWYDEYDHIGYDRSGKQILKGPAMDGVDAALAASDDPNFSRTVYDAYNDRRVVLSDRELELVRRVQAGAFPHPEFAAEEDYSDYYTSQIMQTSLDAGDEPKRRFLPSKWEAMRIFQLVKANRPLQSSLQAAKEGRISLDPKPKKSEKPEVFEIWTPEREAEVAEQRVRGPMHLPAPKMPLPGHAESYRPPEEYLMTPEEEEQWREMDPEERPTNFIPKRFDSLRQASRVGAYAGLCKERFERCLDLYLCPRAFKRRLNIDPESLVPKLPHPRDLRPFPNELCLTYGVSGGARVLCLAVSDDGQYMASGDEAGVVSLWEVATTRRLSTLNLTKLAGKRGGAVAHLAWNPNAQHHLLAAAAGDAVILISTGTGGGDAGNITEALLAAAADPAAAQPQDGDDDNEGEEEEGEEGEGEQGGAEGEQKKVNRGKVVAGRWEKVALRKGAGVGNGHLQARSVIRCVGAVGWVAWHRKGDYLVSVVPAPNSGAGAVAVHQVSKARTQAPLKRRSKGEPQCACFHPSKPFLFVATKQHVRVYHLVKQASGTAALVKRLLSGCKWISYMDIHPSGDHVLLGSLDRRVTWFDMDLASTPYRALKYHSKAVRCAMFHKQFPLMASASDDGAVHVFHAAVYSDLLRSPLIVPLKILRGAAVTGGLGVLSLAFHPRQPWLFSAGADGVVRLFQDI
ncbi:NUC169 domain-containing protein [Tribonema minus]|uniref:Ribosome biogenesis protein BOP1 homolog n=1 Tax=Tribonema minus TaxID=303371 RepID=A0A836CBU6_9STRA|nr:NUC169 domain-containing protein [Tribonema minus]